MFSPCGPLLVQVEKNYTLQRKHYRVYGLVSKVNWDSAASVKVQNPLSGNVVEYPNVGGVFGSTPMKTLTPTPGRSSSTNSTSCAGLYTGGTHELPGLPEQAADLRRCVLLH